MDTSSQKSKAAPHPSAPPPPYGEPTATGFPALSSTGYAPQVTAGAWSSGLFGCCDDVSNCCITCWCPCITFGQIAEIVDKGTTSCGVHGALYALIHCFTGCGCLYSCIYRSKLRNQYHLPESPCEDCLVHFCCESCSLCQEYRELKSRGFNMSLGWQGDASTQSEGVTMAPLMHHGMSK